VRVHIVSRNTLRSYQIENITTGEHEQMTTFSCMLILYYRGN
jgi:hypothetical protein